MKLATQQHGKNMNNRDIYIQKIILQIGKPYQWNSWGPDAFDCSGLVSYCLGLTQKKSASEIAAVMTSGSIVNPKQAPPGALYFYAPNKDRSKIDHVMSVLLHWKNGGIILVGARAGDATTTTLDRALIQRACVSTVFGDYWMSNFVMAADPFINGTNF
jgi:hypothetical protein